MNLAQISLDWIEESTYYLHEFAERKDNFIAIEGLPCSGKSSVIKNLGNQDIITVQELRITPQYESCIAYLELEKSRKRQLTGDLCIGDRSVLSTIAHKSSFLTYENSKAYKQEISKLKEFVQQGEIILPAKIIIFDVNIVNSRERQATRDRNELEGRLWYDIGFLESFKESTFSIANKLYEYPITINSNTQSIQQLTTKVSYIIQQTNGGIIK